MTEKDLDLLFESAKSVDLQTRAEDVAIWVSTAAVATAGLLGYVAKLKLFITKNTLIMLSSTIGIIGITAIALNSTSNKTVEENVLPERVETIQQETPVVDKTIIADPVIDQDYTSPVSKVNTPEVPSISLVPEITTTPLAPLAPKQQVYAPKAKAEDGPITKLAIVGGMNVEIVIDENMSYSLDTKGDSITESKNKEGTLVLTNAKMGKKADITVILKDLSSLQLSGIGDISIHVVGNLQTLHVNNTGVGDVSLDVYTQDLKITYSGIGDMTLKGSSDKAKYVISGVGDLKASKFVVRDLVVKKSGVGDSKVNASEKLRVEMSGVGNLKYWGSPQERNINSSGMGEVREVK